MGEACLYFSYAKQKPFLGEKNVFLVIRHEKLM